MMIIADRLNMCSFNFGSSAAVDKFDSCHRTSCVVGCPNVARERSITKWTSNELFNNGTLIGSLFFLKTRLCGPMMV